ncbi:uncharacterized protein MICPUCDRAFT_38075 [Micromonas pusilla CCMP1545]|uniref:Predicted protein n=2 Tax=Micromonas pusilla TaxID=38833 RepID=C1MID7_MICPC|nr:uncharacterized protein MICPUCDRAFT_38075 [Micromonas pusilla CCMP1545]EEH60363.1 predicted protein [Micromonas pusilla CCMP1545]|eukprot:XP_003055111.1 predicted protein [Micromonas pusilla CCMP1545]
MQVDGESGPTAADQMQEAARMVSSLQTESEGVDLMTLLRETPREAYSYQQLGWPAEITSMTTTELPSVVLERYSTRQSVCFCGVLPSIGRAWATVDNALFLWRFDVPNDVPVEYAGEEQAIVSVGLAKPKPGVFLPSIERVLVVATTTEIALLGVAFESDVEDGASTDGNGARSWGGGMTLHPLNYSCTTDDVVVKDVAGCDNGRVFFAGDDEALYELEYNAADTWRSRKCRKVCHHSATPRLLPSILRLRANDPLKQVCVDEHRCALYTRSENGVVAVYDLGVDCGETPRRIAECRDVASAAAMMRGGGGLFSGGYGGGGGGFGGAGGFGGGGGGAGGGQGGHGGASSHAQKGKRLTHIAVVSAAESATVTLVAVLADGRRVYFTSLPQSTYGGGGGGFGRDARRRVPTACRLAVVQSREPPPQGSATRGMTSAQALRATTTVRPLEVEAAFYRDGLLLLCDAADRDEDARLFMAARDVALPPHLQLAPGDAAVGGGGGHMGVGGINSGGLGVGVGSPGLGGGGGGVGVGAASHARSLREVVTTQQLVGRAASSVGAVGEVPPPRSVTRDLDPPFPLGAPRDLTTAPARLRTELATQFVAPRRRFVAVTNAGIVQLEKARPLDALCKLLAGDVHEQIAQFFRTHGQSEAATMCLAIAVGGATDARASSEFEVDAANARGGATPSPRGGADRDAGAGGYFGGSPSPSPRTGAFGSASRRTIIGSPGAGGTPGSSSPAAGGFDGGYERASLGAATLAERARRALEDPRLTGEPHVDEDGVDGGGGGSIPGGGGGGPFDMGRAVVQPVLRYSGAHRAAYAYAARLLQSTWDRPLAVVVSKHAAGARQTRGGGAGASAAHLNGGGGASINGGVNGGAMHYGASAARRSTSTTDPLAAAAANGVEAVGAAATGWLANALRPTHHAGAPVACTLPGDVLASLERRLRPLETFLARRRARTTATGKQSHGHGGGVNGGARARQRRRLDGPAGALRAEERSIASLRGLLRRTIEAIVLLRVLCENDFTRLAATLSDDARAALSQARSYSHWSPYDRVRVVNAAARDARDRRDPEQCNEFVAESLGALLSVPRAGDVAATCAELADLRCFHGLCALPLAAAAAAANVAAAGDDANILGYGGVASGGLGAMIGRDGGGGGATNALEPSECWELVCVAIRALATGAADPGAPPFSLGGVCASLPAEERARGLATVLERAAQASSPAAAAAATAAAKAAGANAAAAAERAAQAEAAGAPAAPYRPRPPSAALVAVAAATPAEVAGACLDGGGVPGGGFGFIRRVYAELESLQRDAELLSLPAGPLEAYLAERGAFAVAQQGGALSQDQARHLELLARLYAARERHGLAAQVFFALAERKAQGAAVSLDERETLLDLALTHAKSRGPGGDASLNGAGAVASSDVAFIETLEGKITVARFQRRLRATFLERARVGGADAREYERFATELERELRPLSDMYNEYARPRALWGMCLEMLHFSRYDDDDGAVARELWENLLSQAASDAGGGEGEGVAGDPDPRAALAEACARVRELGPKLHPSEQAFPLAHVALKLELMAAGLFATTRPCDDAAELGIVPDALLSATRDSLESVHAAYDRLLATPVQRAHHDRRLAQEQALQTPALRLRLLRSALRVMRRWDEAVAAQTQTQTGGGGFDAYGANASHVRAALGDVCAGYAGEARRLLQVPSSEQGAAEALAGEFERLGTRLIG